MKELISSLDLLRSSCSSDIKEYAHSCHPSLSLFWSYDHLFSTPSPSVSLSTYTCHHSWFFQNLFKITSSFIFDLTLPKAFISIPPWAPTIMVLFRLYCTTNCIISINLKLFDHHTWSSSSVCLEFYPYNSWTEWGPPFINLTSFSVSTLIRSLFLWGPTQFPWPIIVFIDISSHVPSTQVLSYPLKLCFWQNPSTGWKYLCSWSEVASEQLTVTEERHPTPVLLPGKSHGWRSLVGCSPWGR